MESKKELFDIGYTRDTTGEDILKNVDLKGKHYFVTGSNIGIGLETARVLFNHNAFVTLGCRNEKKMTEAKKKIEDQRPKGCEGKISKALIDLASQKQLSEFLKEYKPEQKIDALILNAAVMATPYSHTEDGFEMQMGTNHFGHFILTMGLLPYMTENGRIVSVSSCGHRKGRLEFSDLHWKKRKDEFSKDLFAPYGQSKLANIIFANELNRKLIEAGKKMRANSVYPGFVIGTALMRYNKKLEEELGKCKKGDKSPMGNPAKTVKEGAAPLILVACEKRLEGVGGIYIGDTCCEFVLGVDQAFQKDVWEKLWKVSEESCGIKFPF